MKMNIVEFPSIEEREEASTSRFEPDMAAPTHRKSRLKIQQILVATDFSENSQKALEYANAFAGQFGGSVTLLHVVEPVVYPVGSDYMLGEVEKMGERMQEEAHGRLVEMAKTGVDAEIATVPMIRRGTAWQEITEVARERDIDMIIMGTHGYTGLKHIFLGSTAEKVVRHAPCPVLTVRACERDFV